MKRVVGSHLVWCVHDQLSFDRVESLFLVSWEHFMTGGQKRVHIRYWSTCRENMITMFNWINNYTKKKIISTWVGKLRNFSALNTAVMNNIIVNHICFIMSLLMYLEQKLSRRSSTQWFLSSWLTPRFPWE